MSTPLQRKLSEYLDCLVNTEKKWNPLRCPLHGDRRPSAAINWQKGVFTCKSGCGSMSLEKLHNIIFGEEDMPTEIDEIAEGLPEISVSPTRSRKKQDSEELTGDPPSAFFETAAQHLMSSIEERGITKQTYLDLGIIPILDPLNPNFGYIEIPHVDGRVIRRKFIDGMKGLRYQNSTGDAQPFYGLERLPEGTKDVILVEGVYDYMALYEMGYRNIVAALMSDITEKNAYSLKGKTVFILLDGDYAGYKGARKAVEHFRAMGANPIILELPKFFGKDPHLAWRYCRQSFSPWLAEQIAQYDSVDAKYIKDSFLKNRAPLLVYTSGIAGYDAILGGLKAGVHIIGGKPGSGKSMLVNAIARTIAQLGGRVLNCTYELAKLQIWARTASQFDPASWAEIEMNPMIVQPETSREIEKLGENIRVVAGWNANEIERAINHFDVVILDYIQRMPSSKPEVKIGVSDNIQRMSNLARDHNKIIIVISSLPRAGYSAEGDVGVFKESGDIEYVCQSAMVIKKPTGGNYISCTVLKNTRGPIGNFALQGDMAHCQFTECEFLTTAPAGESKS